MYVIVTNHVNWHRESLRSHRENTGNLKMKFEWVPGRRYSLRESLCAEWGIRSDGEYVWWGDGNV